MPQVFSFSSLLSIGYRHMYRHTHVFCGNINNNVPNPCSVKYFDITHLLSVTSYSPATWSSVIIFLSVKRVTNDTEEEVATELSLVCIYMYIYIYNSRCLQFLLLFHVLQMFQRHMRIVWGFGGTQEKLHTLLQLTLEINRVCLPSQDPMDASYSVSYSYVFYMKKYDNLICILYFSSRN